MKVIFFLCHILPVELGSQVQLYLTMDKTLCYQQSYRQIWVEEYDLKNEWEVRRVKAICGYSPKVCPILK